MGRPPPSRYFSRISFDDFTLDFPKTQEPTRTHAAIEVRGGNITKLEVNGEDRLNTTTTQENTMATTKAAPITFRKLRVYGGPHHGRLLEIHTDAQHVILPGFLTAGETFFKGRSNPSEFYGKNYLYSVKLTKAAVSDLPNGSAYLADQGEIPTSCTANYRVPAVPPKLPKVSDKAHRLIAETLSAQVEYTQEQVRTNAYASREYRDGAMKNANARRNPIIMRLYEYIDSLEQKAGVERTIEVKY